ncbi:ethyltransferase [Pycnococcus provasolii]
MFSGKCHNLPIYVDIGSNDPIQISNTYTLDRHFRWRGICVEPQERFLDAYKVNSTCAHVQKAISPEQRVAFVERPGHGYSGIAGYDNPHGHATKSVDATTLRTLFEEFSVPHDIAYMSVDIEGYEYEAFKTFPFDSHRVRYMTVERPSKELNDLLISKGYCILHNGAWFDDSWYAHSSFPIASPHRLGVTTHPRGVPQYDTGERGMRSVRSSRTFI